jgi:hypothetical protein
MASTNSRSSSTVDTALAFASFKVSLSFRLTISVVSLLMSIGRLLPDEAEAFESTRSRMFPPYGSWSDDIGEPRGSVRETKSMGAWPFWLEGVELNLVVGLVGVAELTEVGEVVLNSSESTATGGTSFFSFFPDLESVTDEIKSEKLVSLKENVIGGRAGATAGVCGASTSMGGERES